MEQIIPWKELSKAIKPYYPKPKGAGRRPIGIERMLRIHFLQHWFDLSDPGAEEGDNLFAGIRPSFTSIIEDRIRTIILRCLVA